MSSRGASLDWDLSNFDLVGLVYMCWCLAKAIERVV